MGGRATQSRLSPGLFLVLIVMLTVFAPISTDMYLPALAIMVSDLGTTEALLNITLYSYMMFLGLSMLVMGPISDKYGRKKLLLACLAEYIVSMALAAFVEDVYSLIALRVLQAIGSGGVLTISTAFVKDSYSGPAVTRVLRIVAIISVVGPVAAPIAGAAIIDSMGWRYTFFAPAAFASICFLMTLFVDETLPDDERIVGGLGKMLHGMRTIASNRMFMIFMVMICMMNMPFMGYLSVSSYVYEGFFGLSATEYSLMLAGALLGAVTISALVARFTSHIVNRRMIPLYFFMGLAGSVLLLTVSSESPFLFLAAFVLILGASTTVRPWGMGVLMRSHKGDSGTLSSMINALFFIVGTIGMFCSTLPWEDYITGLGYIGIAACLVYLALMVIVMRSGKGIKQLDGTPAGEDL